MDQFFDIIAFNDYLPLRIIAVLVLACAFIRRRTPPAPELVAPLIGNMSNNIYHSNQCQYGRKVGKANRQEMFTHAEALHEGFRPCKECIGPVPAEDLVDSGGIQIISFKDTDAAMAYFENEWANEAQHSVTFPVSKKRIT